MDFKTLLSYKPFRKIEVDTYSNDLNLGESDFTFAISISPPAAIISDDMMKLDIMKTQKEYNTSFSSEFSPIFSFNNILLYNHEANYDFFYNAHCCYIYNNKIHWLINGLSNTPLLHLQLPI